VVNPRGEVSIKERESGKGEGKNWLDTCGESAFRKRGTGGVIWAESRGKDEKRGRGGSVAVGAKRVGTLTPMYWEKCGKKKKKGGAAFFSELQSTVKLEKMLKVPEHKQKTTPVGVPGLKKGVTPTVGAWSSLKKRHHPQPIPSSPGKLSSGTFGELPLRPLRWGSQSKGG